MYFYSFFSECLKETRLKGTSVTWAENDIHSVFSRTPQGNRGAPTPLYITASFAIGHIGVLSHHYPSPSTVTTGSLKCHPQRPKDDCWNVIGSAGAAWLLWSSYVFKKLVFIHLKWM